MRQGDKFNFAAASESLKDQYLNAILEAEELFKRRYSLPLRVAYGTLLGAVREKDFIRDDTDIDLTYISGHKDKKNVIEEMNSIYDDMVDRGIVLFDFRKKIINPHGGQIHIRVNKTILDVTTSWIDDYGMYFAFPYNEMVSGEDVLPLKRIPFRDKTVPAPARPEKILDFLYNDWANPIGRGSDGTERHGFRRQWNYGMLRQESA